LEAAGGFDESIGWFGEDTALGWAVLEQGWDRGFAAGARVVHDVEERGFRARLSSAYFHGHFVDIAARHPGFAHDAFWRPWAFGRHHARFALAAVGVAMAGRHPAALALALPWWRERRPPRGHPRMAALSAERAAVDAAAVAGMVVASARRRRFVL
jgi:GT2 family glycosyltransferase